MIRIRLAIALSLLSIAHVKNVQAIDCNPADIQLLSQSAVNNFQANHGPDCDTVTGELLIGISDPAQGSSDISNLHGLAGLTTISGGLRVERNPSLSNLSGLDNVSIVEVGIAIRYNDALTTLDDLSSLASFSGAVVIHDNPELSDISALSAVKGAVDGLYVSHCGKLTSIHSLSGITSVNGTLAIFGTGLINVNGLANVASIGGDLFVADNAALANVDGLESLVQVGDNLFISNNPISDLDGLAALESIGGDLLITDSYDLLDVDGLSALTSVGGRVVLSFNNLLDGYDGLNGLEQVGGDFLVLNHRRHIRLDGFQALTTVGGRVWVASNSGLGSINGFNQLLEVAGDVDIENHSKLITIHGFQSLRKTGGDLRLFEAPLLAEVTGFGELESVAGSVSIESNDSLLRLNSFSSIHHVGQRLIISTNPALKSIGGFSDLVHIGSNLEIRDNEVLSDCGSLEAVVDGFDHGSPGPGIPPIPDVGGAVFLKDNAAGCNFVSEIAPPPPLASSIVGSWYDPERSGTGFMVHGVNNNLAVGYYYGFDPNGDRFWLLGLHEGAIEWEHDVRFEAVYVTGGDFQSFDPEQIEEHPWGQMELALANCDQGVITMTGDFSGGGSADHLVTPLTRLAPVAGFECYGPRMQHPTDGLTGTWFDPRTPGQGLAVHKVDLDTGVVYFYGFDAQGTPLWLIGVWDGTLIFGEELELQMNQVTGGTFEVVDPDQIVEAPWGTLRIRFEGCTTAWAQLFGDDGSQEFDLVLLAGSAGLECSE